MHAQGKANLEAGTGGAQQACATTGDLTLGWVLPLSLHPSARLRFIGHLKKGMFWVANEIQRPRNSHAPRRAPHATTTRAPLCPARPWNRYVLALRSVSHSLTHDCLVRAPRRRSLCPSGCRSVEPAGVPRRIPRVTSGQTSWTGSANVELS